MIYKVKRYIQDPAHCAVAACASLVNYYNNEITYEDVKPLAYKICHNSQKSFEGMESSQSALLLNELGFKAVTIICADLNYVDYSWAKLSKKKLIQQFIEFGKSKREHRLTVNGIAEFLKKKGYKNKFIIDHLFMKHIKKSLDEGYPILVSFNWSMLFRCAKENEEGEVDGIGGDYEEHLVVARGYDSKGVHIVDSNNIGYTYSRKKFKTGFYRIAWEELLVALSPGDVIVAKGFEL